MGNYDNTNSGALFRNKEKQGNQPDYKGNLNVGGEEFWLSGWLKTSKAGEKYFSLSVQAKNQQRSAPKSAPAEDEFSDDIPF